MILTKVVFVRWFLSQALLAFVLVFVSFSQMLYILFHFFLFLISLLVVAVFLLFHIVRQRPRRFLVQIMRGSGRLRSLFISSIDDYQWEPGFFGAYFFKLLCYSATGVLCTASGITRSCELILPPEIDQGGIASQGYRWFARYWIFHRLSVCTLCRRTTLFISLSDTGRVFHGQRL